MQEMGTVQKTYFVCERCGHEWPPRDPTKKPTVCPKCRSPYWDRPRKNPRKINRSEGATG